MPHPCAFSAQGWAGTLPAPWPGNGRRAAKVGSKLYWYGSGGEILAETDAAGNTLNEYVFFGGRRVAVVPASGSALYYAEDLLGSSRVIAQSNGTLCYDADFTPFGGERSYTSTCAQNYKFEGEERDTETQNGDFGAREYTWRFGRWLSADWSSVPVAVPYANLTNPQTLNLYAMVADDPESFADLDINPRTLGSRPEISSAANPKPGTRPRRAFLRGNRPQIRRPLRRIRRWLRRKIAIPLLRLRRRLPIPPERAQTRH